jgi:UDP-glucuronate 4-epimerase
MRIVVTDAAAFVGSHLTERCLEDGHDVVGSDSLTNDYPKSVKWRNQKVALTSPNFEFHESDIGTGRLEVTLGGADVVVQQAGQPGVRASWGSRFGPYLNDLAPRQSGLSARSPDLALRSDLGLQINWLVDQ